MVRRGLIITIISIVVVVVAALAVAFVLLRRRKQVFAVRPVPPAGSTGRYNTLASEAVAAAKKYGELATYSQLEQAQKDGAQWCVWGWVMDDRTGSATANTLIMALPMQEAVAGCGSSAGSVGVSVHVPQHPTEMANVVIYGIKPRESLNDGDLGHIYQWKSKTSTDSTTKWSKYLI
jgi:hypothetical protein